MANTGGQNGNCTDEVNKFRDVFKFYKKRNPPPDLSKVIEFGRTNDKKIQELRLGDPSKLPKLNSLQPVEQWKAYGYEGIEGFYFLKNIFKPNYQKYWVKRCLVDYPRKPNISNLDAHHTIEDCFSFWDHRRDTDSSGKSLLQKLRWVTLGYHHDWNTKLYSREKCGDFPVDLGYLGRYISAAIGFSEYTAEAAIINYYHHDSTLGGHTDHSEFDKESPLISISFGQTGVFLLGGNDKSTKPIAMYIVSGDTVIMSGKCRLSYHALPKVLPVTSSFLSRIIETQDNDIHDEDSHGEDAHSCKRAKLDFQTAKRDYSDEGLRSCEAKRKPSTCDNPYNLPEGSIPRDKTELESFVSGINLFIQQETESMEWEPYLDFLQTTRINMNVRQVFPRGKSFDDFPPT